MSQGWVFPHLLPPLAQSPKRVVTNFKQIEDHSLRLRFHRHCLPFKTFSPGIPMYHFLLELTVEIFNVIQKLSVLVKYWQIYCKDSSRSNLMFSLKRNWGIPFALIIKLHGNHWASVDKKRNTSDWNDTLKWLRLNKTFQQRQQDKCLWRNMWFFRMLWWQKISFQTAKQQREYEQQSLSIIVSKRLMFQITIFLL